MGTTKELSMSQLNEMIGSAVSKAVAERWEERDAKAREAQENQVSRKYANGLFDGALADGSNGPNDDLTRKPIQGDKGLNFARWVKYMHLGKGDNERAAKLAKDAGHIGVAKALSLTSLTQGGSLVPPEYSQEFIDLLYPRTVVRASGPTIMPMESGSLTIPFLSTGASASYVGENQTIATSQLGTGQLTLSEKKLAIVSPASNDLLRANNSKADAIIRDNMVRAMAIKEDVTFLRSDGSNGQPKGMLGWVDSGNSFSANVTVNVPNVTNDLGQAIYLLENANVTFVNPAWYFSPRTRKWLMTARDANSNLVFAPEMRTGTLMGYPFFVSQQIPNNLGSGSSSEVYFANAVDLVIAERTQLILDVFPGGVYNDGTGLVSGAVNDQTVFRTIACHDFGCQYRGKEIAYMSAVNWS